MATRARDPVHNHSIPTRNKENIPHATSPSTPNRDRIARPSLVKSPDKNEFWTDSFLGNNASNSSLIPSPLPAKNGPISNSRKTIRQQKPTHDVHRPSRHGLTRHGIPATHSEDSKINHPKPLTHGTSPIPSTGLSTPPRSPEGSVTESASQILSSPPQALTDTYSRIDQEEDLAATEGEISDPESESAETENENAPVTNGILGLRPSSSNSLRQMPQSRGSTPTNQIPLRRGHPAPDENPTLASVLSDPTGMSFVDQLSDPGLRSTLTPHMVQSAADREALHRAWKSKKPVAFGKAGKVLLDANDIADSVSPSPRVQPERVVAFSKAARIKLASDHLLRPQHQRTFSDVTEQIDRASHDQHFPGHYDNWHTDDLRREAMPHNPRVHRDPYFPRNHGFPERSTASDQDAAEKDSIDRRLRKARSESPFTSSSRPALGAPQSRRENSEQPQASSHLKSLTQPQEYHPDADLTLGSRPSSYASSDIWTQAAADRPLKSIERDIYPSDQRRQSATQGLYTSPEKSRRFDIDFTGQSFQVSESPPVRGKNSAQDYSRDREIRGLAQQAVTTNRLSQLRAKESQEKLRQQSMSPVSEPDPRQWLEKTARDAHESGTLAAIHRMSSGSSGSRSPSTSIQNSTPDKSRSHDILQRLARGSSSTPRSSTPSDKTIGGVVIDGRKEATLAAQSTREKSNNDIARRDSGEEKRSGSDVVQATPRIVGAWTDTILPATVKTTKRNTQHSRYAQTPHISAGGWVDTPAPDGPSNRLESVREVTQEVPEELMNGIAKDSASDSTLLAEDQASSGAPAATSQAGESLAQRVLRGARSRNDSNDDARSDTNADNSLVLGNTTMQSLQNVLDMDMDETTILSQLGFEEPPNQTDTQVLDSLGSKLGTLLKNIQSARSGISNLEHQMSQPAQSDTVVVTSEAAQRVLRSSSTSFPLRMLTFSIPIPILYRSRKPSQYAPRPTLLGWAVLAFWSWYLLESAFAEMYSHPRYAEQYTWPSQLEPEFPFVLPTMLWRWSHLQFLHPALIHPIQRFLWGMVRMVGMWFGLTDGFVDSPAAASATSQAVVQETVQVVGFDMNHDEYL